MFKNHLLMTTAAFAPPTEGGGPNEGEDQHEDQDLEGQEGDDTLEAGEQDASADEGADETEGSEGDDEGQVDDAPARRPNRAQSRIQSLTQTAREAKERADRIERELQELRADQRRRDQQSQQESPETKAARRALMDPMEVMREDLAESEKRTAALLHQQAIQTQETQDKLLYNSILRDAPHLKKYDGEVEKVRLEQQAQGRFVPREVLLDLAIGRAARAAASKAAPKAKREGQRRIENQRVQPAGSRGDTATARGKQGDSAEKRLENVPI